jgi:putative transposase
LDIYSNLDKAMNLVKGRSARLANLYLKRTGSKFWGDEYHDRYIRNFEHFNKAVDYIKNNPVKAKLCLHWLHHLHTWVRPDYLEMKLIYPRFKQ